MSRIDKVAALMKPERLWSRAEVRSRPSPVPRVAGVYAWYFLRPPAGVSTRDCHKIRGAALLYVGISPKPPPANGAAPSRQTLCGRIRCHFSGNAAGSTLRLTLGCLLAETLGIELRRVGSGRRLTFADGEQRLSEWMDRNARVCWMPVEQPWTIEEQLISKLSLPLNLRSNERHSFHPVLTEIRRDHRYRANTLPIWKRSE
ncbi:MAG TPA: hypothetical protein VGD45_04760 [Steroidobacter sp.]|uniref:GIY-YIG nuclease family protein n=1 Tax=Steroidobacter sp. TaxID=1978227 RepID=UPI002EDB4A40